MTHDEKINYMRVAAGVCGYGFKDYQLDLLVSLYELVMEKGKDGAISDIVDVEAKVKKRSEVKERSKLLDKVSERV